MARPLTPKVHAGAPDDLEPRKLPRQARSRATFNAILDACGQVLASGSYEALTTNAISERAGVSIGTLYEYFPNREAIVAALVAESCGEIVRRMRQAAEEAAVLPAFQGMEHLLGAGIEALGAHDNMIRTLLRDVPFVVQLPAYLQTREALTELCQDIGLRSAAHLTLPDPTTDTWLISQMLFAAMMEIASRQVPPARRDHLRLELARLTFRMTMGRDPWPHEEAPGTPAKSERRATVDAASGL